MQKQREELKEKVVKILEKEYIKELPEDLLECYNKYKNSFQSTESFCIRAPTFYSFYINAPHLLSAHEKVKNELSNQNSKIYKKIMLLVEKIGDINIKYNSTKNKIKCTISKLNTYNKVRSNFPEAYKALEIIHQKETGKVEENKEKDTLCDDVEKLRAELQLIEKVKSQLIKRDK